MKMRFHKLAPALLLVGLASAAFAQAAPQPAGHFAIASFDAIVSAGKDLGLPADGMVKQVETTFPFLGEGSIDTTKPEGIIVLAGDALPAITSPKGTQAAIIAIPVKEGKVTPETLKAAGAVALDDKPGIFKLSQFNIRRLGDYVLVQMGSTLGLAELTEVPFASDFKTPGNLVVATVDMDAVRKLAPDGYKQVVGSLKDTPDSRLQAFATSFGTAADKLQKATFAVGTDEKSLHLKTWLVPLGPGTPPKPVARPAFPASFAAQMHIVYPSGDSTDLLKRLTSAIPDDAFTGLDKPTEEKARALIQKAARLVAGGTGVSVGFAARSGRPVVYIVSQFSDDVDYAAEVKSFLSAAKDLDPNDKGPQPDVSEYDAGGKKVTRVVLPDGGPVIDGIAAGKVVYITISPHDGRYVQEIADAGLSNTTSSLLCAGVLNLGAIYDAASQLGAPPIPGGDDLKKALQGSAITWTVQNGDGNVLYIDVAVPKEAVKAGLASVNFSAAPASAPASAPQ